MELDKLISLALTVPTLAVSLTIVFLYSGRAFQGLQNMLSKPLGRDHWLAIGIALGFAGGFMDNLYWAIPWTLDYINDPRAEWWFARGAFPNIFSRQLADWLAGVCHMIAALLVLASTPGARISNEKTWRIVWGFNIACVLLGVGFAAMLYVIRQR